MSRGHHIAAALPGQAEIPGKSLARAPGRAGSESLGGVAIKIAAFLVVLLLGLVSQAHAEVPFTIGGYSSNKEATCGTHFSPSSTEATYVTVNYQDSVASAAQVGIKFFEGKTGEEVLVGWSTVRATSIGTIYRLSGSAIVGAGQFVRFDCEGPEGAERKVTYSQTTIKGGEGPAGPEGKEGKEGPAGKEGPEGKAGSSSPGKTEVTGFSPTAEATLGEGVETVEIMGWIIVGTLLAGMVALLAWKLTGAHL